MKNVFSCCCVKYHSPVFYYPNLTLSMYFCCILTTSYRIYVLLLSIVFLVWKDISHLRSVMMLTTMKLSHHIIYMMSLSSLPYFGSVYQSIILQSALLMVSWPSIFATFIILGFIAWCLFVKVDERDYFNDQQASFLKLLSRLYNPSDHMHNPWFYQFCKWCYKWKCGVLFQ